jgi:hypothetical protein
MVLFWKVIGLRSNRVQYEKVQNKRNRHSLKIHWTQAK